jgi:hypothetical protein
MITDTQRRNQILRRISRIPKDKLKELDEYVSKLEQEISKKSNTLSFAGAWEDMDNSTFDDLTKNLVSNRQKNRRRIDE